jgi:hypothetical protein
MLQALRIAHEADTELDGFFCCRAVLGLFVGQDVLQQNDQQPDLLQLWLLTDPSFC